jgi:hypothetical protein
VHADSLYPSLQRAEDVGAAGESWIGYKQDLRPCQHGLALTVEPSFSAFHQALPVPEFIATAMSRNRRIRDPWSIRRGVLEGMELRTAEQTIKSLRVRCSRLLSRGLRLSESVAHLSPRCPPASPAPSVLSSAFKAPRALSRWKAAGVRTGKGIPSTRFSLPSA